MKWFLNKYGFCKYSNDTSDSKKASPFYLDLISCQIYLVYTCYVDTCLEDSFIKAQRQ
jgi:hypothetical protein